MDAFVVTAWIYSLSLLPSFDDDSRNTLRMVILKKSKWKKKNIPSTS